AVDGFREVAGPAGTPKFTIAEDVDADLLLKREHLEDGPVFELTQLLEWQSALNMGRVRGLELGRSEETADLIGAQGVGHAAQGSRTSCLASAPTDWAALRFCGPI